MLRAAAGTGTVGTIASWADDGDVRRHIGGILRIDFNDRFPAPPTARPIFHTAESAVLLLFPARNRD